MLFSICSDVTTDRNLILSRAYIYLYLSSNVDAYIHILQFIYNASKKIFGENLKYKLVYLLRFPIPNLFLSQFLTDYSCIR